MHSLLEIYYRGGRNVYYMHVTTCDGMRRHAATSVLRAASHEIRHVCCRSAALPIQLCKTSFTPGDCRQPASWRVLADSTAVLERESRVHLCTCSHLNEC
jgi:hypothetical protein